MEKPLNNPDKEKAIKNNSLRNQLDEQTAANGGPRDGHDNTGTQGYDSLSDDAFTGDLYKKPAGDTQSHTGSSSEDFDEEKFSDREDKALDSGI
ncbi:hypothetical protein [Pedobacter yulinensis]|nr:hypothetical protein [Pedobacter yulinensis]